MTWAASSFGRAPHLQCGGDRFEPGAVHQENFGKLNIYMSIDNPEGEKNRLEILQEVISGSPRGIEEEFAKTVNDWLSCYGSRIFAVEAYLSSPKLEALIPPGQYQTVLARLEQLKDKLANFKQQYPEKNTIPPDSIKQELLDDLSNLLDQE